MDSVPGGISSDTEAFPFTGIHCNRGIPDVTGLSWLSESTLVSEITLSLVRVPDEHCEFRLKIQSDLSISSNVLCVENSLPIR